MVLYKFPVSYKFLFRESPNLHHEPEVRDNPSSVNITETILETKALEKRSPQQILDKCLAGPITTRIHEISDAADHQVLQLEFVQVNRHLRIFPTKFRRV